MTDLNNLSSTQAPLGARLPRFLTQAAAPAPVTTSFDRDSVAVNAPAGGAGVDPAQIQQQLQSPQPADRFRAVVAITNMPPQQAIPLLQMAAQNDNAQVRDLANQALQVMQRMPGTQQPATNQPGTQQPQPQPTPYQAPAPYQAPTNLGLQIAPGAPMSPGDAQIMMGVLQGELGSGQERSMAAIPQLVAIAQQNPAMKEAVVNLLLNHIYNEYNPSVSVAMRGLATLADPRAIPYLEMVARQTGRQVDEQALARAIVEQMKANPSGQPGTASAQALATPEFVRMHEPELAVPGARGMAAFEKIRAQLGADPRAKSPIQQEVLRVMLTLIATSYNSETVAAACTLIGQMGSRDMDSLRYLQAVTTGMGQTPATRAAAMNAMRQIMATP